MENTLHLVERARVGIRKHHRSYTIDYWPGHPSHPPLVSSSRLTLVSNSEEIYARCNGTPN